MIIRLSPVQYYQILGLHFNTRFVHANAVQEHCILSKGYPDLLHHDLIQLSKRFLLHFVAQLHPSASLASSEGSFQISQSLLVLIGLWSRPFPTLHTLVLSAQPIGSRFVMDGQTPLSRIIITSYCSSRNYCFLLILLSRYYYYLYIDREISICPPPPIRP